jgi:hypothetical protein
MSEIPLKPPIGFRTPIEELRVVPIVRIGFTVEGAAKIKAAGYQMQGPYIDYVPGEKINPTDVARRFYPKANLRARDLMILERP